MDVLERRAVFSGVGQSVVGRRLPQTALELTIDACLEAIDDAGLTRADIDGIATYPGKVDSIPGFSEVGVMEIQDALRLNLKWYNGALENPSQLGSVITAFAAVAAGYARHVLCFRTVTETRAQGDRSRGSLLMNADAEPGRATGAFQWLKPYGAPSAANWIAEFAQRHFQVYGTTREQLGQIALTARENAGRNPKAIYRDPLSMDDYLSARMISTPLCLYDCDVPCDGSTAFVVSSVDTAADLRRPPIHVEAVGTAINGRNSWDQWADMSTMCLRDAAQAMWSRTTLTPDDVDLAEMYDGFSYLTMCWIESMGFCGHGEAGPFLEGGARIKLDGPLPLNTHGGQLSAGRLHGYGFVHEACTQLWGRAGDRQVPNAPEVGVVAAGGGNIGGCMLLRRA